MPSSSPARYLAPAALVAAALAVLITWAASTGSEAPPAQDAGQTAAQEAPARQGGGSERKDSERERGGQPSGERQPAGGGGPDENGVYTVQTGDNIGSIAEENDTTVEEILALNPRADPQTLQVGDRLLLP
ncbi:MAG TPA: LysM peptidoglycan-binding domain-containing protein [Solirubrobacteraceae bacterium]|nr:LysM peptidoglycan-binding domain-containing protein [Solirubrobacteraceae bacterium]